MDSKLANVLDLELNDGEIFQIGITTVNLEKLEIEKMYKINIWPLKKPLNPIIANLCHITEGKLKKSGVPMEQAVARIKEKYGAKNRLLVTDMAEETLSFGADDPFGPERINVSMLYHIICRDFYRDKSLEYMMGKFSMRFEGTLHDAMDDSKNIARLFIAIMKTSIYGYESHHPLDYIPPRLTRATQIEFTPEPPEYMEKPFFTNIRMAISIIKDWIKRP